VKPSPQALPSPGDSADRQRVKTSGDPGYAATAVMLSEAALAWPAAHHPRTATRPGMACWRRRPVSATHWSNGRARPAWNCPSGAC